MTAGAGRPLRELLLDAVRQALAGDWQSAHLVVQEHDGDPTAAWIHAVVHRKEVDLDNARYWYGRCGRALPAQLSTEAELREIASTLGG